MTTDPEQMWQRFADVHGLDVNDAGRPFFVDGVRAGRDEARAEADRLRATLGKVVAQVDEWERDDRESLNTHGQHLMGGSVLSCAEHIRAILAEVDPVSLSDVREDIEVHMYGAAGFTSCGLETGGGISRHDGYAGPRRRTTTMPWRVTCPNCRAKEGDQ